MSYIPPSHHYPYASVFPSQTTYPTAYHPQHTPQVIHGFQPSTSFLAPPATINPPSSSNNFPSELFGPHSHEYTSTVPTDDPSTRRGEYTVSRRQRVAMACVYCRKRKIRCDGLDTCSNCSRAHRQCHYAPVPPDINKTRPRRVATALDSPTSPGQTESQSATYSPVDYAMSLASFNPSPLQPADSNGFEYFQSPAFAGVSPMISPDATFGHALHRHSLPIPQHHRPQQLNYQHPQQLSASPAMYSGGNSMGGFSFHQSFMPSVSISPAQMHSTFPGMTDARSSPPSLTPTSSPESSTSRPHAAAALKRTSVQSSSGGLGDFPSMVGSKKVKHSGSIDSTMSTHTNSTSNSFLHPPGDRREVPTPTSPPYTPYKGYAAQADMLKGPMLTFSSSPNASSTLCTPDTPFSISASGRQDETLFEGTSRFSAFPIGLGICISDENTVDDLYRDQDMFSKTMNFGTI